MSPPDMSIKEEVDTLTQLRELCMFSPHVGGQVYVLTIIHVFGETPNLKAHEAEGKPHTTEIAVSITYRRIDEEEL